MRTVPRILPDGLAGRFAVLLITVLLAAGIAASALLFVQRGQSERNLREAREIERIASIVPALESAAPPLRRQIAHDASNRLTRYVIAPRPIVQDRREAPRPFRNLTASLAEALPGREIRGAVLSHRMSGPPPMGPRFETLAVSVQLAHADGQPQLWLNVISRGNWFRPPGARGTVLPVFLGLSLLAVLGVGLIFVRRLTRPLTELARAARAAGHGNREIRVSESGAGELREAARAFNEMQDRIARFDADRMRMLAAVGHDLRTPITSLRIRAEMLDEEEAVPMIRTLEDMTVMVNGLVAYARGAGDGEDSEMLDLGALLSRLCDERGVSFLCRRNAYVTGRPVALGRAIGNVVDNARRFGTSAQVALLRDAEAAIITVEDDGPGIPPDRLDAMFEPFVRGDESRNQETGGAGLGLAIARNIIATHGGMITLENMPECGLRATIRLPLSTRPHD